MCLDGFDGMIYLFIVLIAAIAVAVSAWWDHRRWERYGEAVLREMQDRIETEEEK